MHAALIAAHPQFIGQITDKASENWRRAANHNCEPNRRRYVAVNTKFAIAFAASLAWLALSLWLATPWMHDLARMTNWTLAIFAVGGIALVPGFMNAFLVAGLLLDRRPTRKRLVAYPGITILIAAYNEGKSIASTIASIERLHYVRFVLNMLKLKSDLL